MLPSNLRAKCVFVTLAAALFLPILANAQASGYNYARAITIDHHKVPNTDQSNFPVLISGTFSFLATSSNGGHVTNANGYDIIFTSDAAGQTKLDHEIDNYDAATGKAAFWVRVPTLSHTTDTPIYVWYGNSSVVSSQENKTGVWQSGYAGVWHMGATALSGNDSTANSNNATNHGVTAATGAIGGAGSFDGTGNTYLRVPSSSSYKPSGSITLQAWVKVNAVANLQQVFCLDYRANGTWTSPYASYALNLNTTTPIPGIYGTFNTVGASANSPTPITASQWAHVVATYDGSKMVVYANGMPVITTAQTGTFSYGTSLDLSIGTTSPYASSQAVNGLIDEARISTVARSADWVRTEYNNQSSPSSFAYVSPTESVSSSPNLYQIELPATSFSYARAITIDHRRVPNTDQIDFPVLISGTFPFLATTANGGRLQNAGGYDVVFTSDAAGQVKLDHEVDSYDPATGQASFWVRVPTLSHTTDTSIYVWYGNSSIVAPQENKAGVWQSGFAGVWHMGSSSISGADSTANANDGTIKNVTASAGLFGKAGTFDGTGSTYIRVPSSNSFKPTSAITLQGWVKMTGATSWPDIFSLDYRANGTWSAPFAAYALNFNSNTLIPRIHVAIAGTAQPTDAPTAVSAGNWAQVVATYDGSNQIVYVNGMPVVSRPQTGAISYGTSLDLDIGTRSPYTSAEAVNGLIDEARISTVARSADWIKTEFNNQQSPGTFFFVSPMEANVTQPSAYSLQVAPADFTYIRPITIDHTKVPNTDQQDFPILISGTFPFLATTTNSGQVQNASGYDIVFTADSLGQTKLDHEIDSFDPVTGKVAFWVRVPSLSHTADTVIYLHYGNSSVLASQENKPGVWQNSYAGVWHLGATGAGSDSGPSSNDAVSAGTSSATGKVGTAASFAGTAGTYLSVANSTSLKPTSALTMEGWVNPSQFTAWGKVFSLDYRANNSWNGPWLAYGLSFAGSASQMHAQIANAAGGNVDVYSASSIPNSQWTHVVSTYDGSQLRMYLNGTQNGTPVSVTGSINYGTSKDLVIGKDSTYQTSVVEAWSGLLDELRISSVARSADWIQTQYNNQSSPSTFFAIGGTDFLRITTDTLPQATQYYSYSSSVVATGGTTPYSWSVISGALPAGLSLNSSTGAITGTPTATGTSSFTVRVQDSTSAIASQSLTITTVAPPALAISTSSLGGGVVGSSYSATVQATGGVPPYSWSVSTGSLPAGLSLNASTGAITGTPSAAGLSNFTVRAQDSLTTATTKALSIRAFSVTSLAPSAAAIGGTVTISGVGFGSTQGTGVVKVNTTTATVTSWTDSSIAVTVPSSAQSGTISVTIDGASSGLSFTVQGSPQVTSIAPASGTVGAVVTITGTGFGNTQSNSIVSFNGTTATPVSWSSTQIVVTVPFQANNGPISVQVASLVGKSSDFSVFSNTQLTDSLGNNTYYQSNPTGGTWLPASSSGPGCSSCGMRGNQAKTYDARGNVLTTTDELGHTTTYTYDANDNVATISRQLGGQTLTTSYTYNSFGQVLTGTDSAGNVTTNTYDSKGNLLTTTTPAPASGQSGSVTTFEYYANGLLKKITDPRNNATTITYTAAGLIQTITDAQSNVTTFEYDSRGNRTAIVDEANRRTELQYDAMNRLTKIINPDLTFTQFTYDGRGRRISITDANNKTTALTYDDADRLMSVIDAANSSTNYGYDTENNITSITDPLNRVTSFQYDARGHVSRATYPSTLYEVYNYDNLGNLLSKVDRKNNTTTYYYDALNRMYRKVYQDGTEVNFTYDALGRLTQVVDATGTYTLSYDNMGRLTGSTTQYAFLTGQTFTMSYGYDAASNRTSMTDPQSGVTSYVYDTLGRLTSLTNPQSLQFNFGYDNLGRRTSLTRPNGVVTSYSYDNLSRLLSVLHRDSAMAVIDGATYTVDNVGNRVSKLNSLAGLTENYTYDVTYQLTQAAQGASTTEWFNYDKAGNRTASHLSSSYTVNSSNQITTDSNATYVYDNDGNTLSKTVGSDVTTYGWDYENRLTSVQLPNGGGSISYKYDPFGRRIYRSGPSGTSIWNSDGSDVIEERNGIGSVLAQYTQGPDLDEPLAVLKSGVVSYYQADGQGSITSLSNTAGALAATYLYDTYGNQLSTSGSLTNSFRYAAREWDQDSGLYFNRARYYSPATGRFLSEDPIAFGGGLNFYGYVRNNPGNLVDPSGLQTTRSGNQVVPKYDPGYWNDDHVFTNNCYSYACNRRYPPGNPRKPQPGEASGRRFEQFTCSSIIAAAKRDGLQDDPGCCPKNYHRVLLVIGHIRQPGSRGAGELDYHWYRQDESGGWSSKHGWDPVGPKVLDPLKDAREWGYDTNCGTLCAPTQ